MAGETRQCLEAYGSGSCSGGQASALQPETMMVLMEIQSLTVRTPLSTSVMHYFPSNFKEISIPEQQNEKTTRQTGKGK